MNTYDARLKTKSTITVAGPSQSGKTTLVEKMVDMKDDLFNESIDHVIWFCAFPPKQKLQGVVYHIGLPSLNLIQPNSLVIVDDYMKELAHSSELTSLMTKAVHHLPMTLIYITQNMFQKSQDAKTRRLNTQYMIIFKNPHDKAQIDYIGRQMYPVDKQFLSNVFNHVTQKQPFSYIFIDCQQATPDVIRIRTDICDNVNRVFVPLSIPLTV